MLQITLILSYIISLSFSSLMANVLMFSMALFSWLVVNFSVPHSVALLFILSSALFIIRSHFMWYLNSVTFLSWLIPTLFFPYCITGRYTTVGTTNQNQESQYLHAYCEDLLILPM